MDAIALLGVGMAGALLGLLTGLVPGLHVNTLAAVALAVLPWAGEPVALTLVAVGVAHTFVSILPATYLGAPGEDTALCILPAHRLLLAGRAPEAIRTSVHASLLGLLGAVMLLAPLRWLLGAPLHGLVLVDRVAVWLLIAALALLLFQEAARDRRRVVPAIAVMVLAGWLGIIAFDAPTVALVAVPSTPLLPLLAGLFGLPGLVMALHGGRAVPWQDPPAAWGTPTVTRVRDVLPGLGVTAFSAVLPGVTSAVSTSLARVGRRDDDPLPFLATLSVVNTAHSVLALGMLWIVARTRSGLAQAVETLVPVQGWEAGPPPGLLGGVVLTMLAAGVVGAAGTLWLERPVRRWAYRVPARVPTLVGLGLLVALTAVLSGAWGLLLLAMAAFVGTLPLAFGVRRVHLVAALIVPILVRIA